MKTDNLSDIRKRLWESVEMAHVRFQLIAWTTGYAVSMAICWFNRPDIPQVMAMMAVFVSVMFAPILGFWLIRTWRIFRSPEEYVFCPTELNQPHHAPLGRGLFTFMGVIETETDGRFAVETHAIFQSAGVAPLMEDYVGRTVTLAWNRDTEMVVVIG